MQIDWFTFVAQIVNFLILVALLRRFLYGPVIDAMDRREGDIQSRLRAAQQQLREAQEEGALYRARREAFEHRRDTMLMHARQEAETQQQALLREAREDVARAQAQWRDALRREQSTFLADVRRQVGTESVETVRHMLQDLAGASLEARIVDVFLDRLAAAEAETAARMAAAIEDEEPPVVVKSAFTLSAPQRERIEAQLRAQHPALRAPRYEVDASLIAGVEVKVGGWKMGWSAASYLEALEARLRAALDPDRAGDTQPQEPAASGREASVVLAGDAGHDA